MAYITLNVVNSPRFYRSNGESPQNTSHEHIRPIENNAPDDSNFATFDKTSFATLIHAVNQRGKTMNAFENLEITKSVLNPNLVIINEICPAASPHHT